MANTCAVHGGSEGVARCATCDVWLCDACFRFLIADKPACVRCARELSTRARRRVALGVFTALVSMAAAGVIGVNPGDLWPSFALAFALFGAVAGIILARSGPPQNTLNSARPRGPHEQRPDLPSDGDARVRRARIRLALATLSPSLSGRLTALSVLAAMSLAALSFPKLLHLSRWVELEIVLFSWWIMGVLGLSFVLYRGLRVDDDHHFYAPGLPVDRSKRLTEAGCEGCDPGCFHVGGCDEGGIALVLVGLGALAAVAVSVLVAWVVVEIVLPFAFLAFYLTATAAIRRAAHDRHECRGRGLESLRWGVTWSTLYIAPLALVLFALHALIAHTR